jgi:UDP-2-acetamido-2,6-beta-L-arabino-hexul-4-ose reductase
MIVGITGANGFIGWHLRAFLKNKKDVTEVRSVSTDDFKNADIMKNFVSSVDAIVHLAGVNRGEDASVYETNMAISKTLLDACRDSVAKPHIIFASSIHYERNTGYGRSKKECMQKFQEWSNQSGALCASIVLPNVFGEFGTPFYNSVVSTFCYQVANQETPCIVNDSETEQLYVQEATKTICCLLDKKYAGIATIRGKKIKVSEILGRLQKFEAAYSNHEVPNVNDAFDLNLFNTYRSYKFPHSYPRKFTLREDNRGGLWEIAKCSSGGHVFLSTTKPNVTRGNHYHTRKIERFAVVKGKAEIKVRKLFDKESKTYLVSGDDRVYVDIPTFCTHNITNIGNEDLLALFWCNEVFNPEDTDTFYEEV